MCTYVRVRERVFAYMRVRVHACARSVHGCACMCVPAKYIIVFKRV